MRNGHGSGYRSVAGNGERCQILMFFCWLQYRYTWHVSLRTSPELSRPRPALQQTRLMLLGSFVHFHQHPPGPTRLHRRSLGDQLCTVLSVVAIRPAWPATHFPRESSILEPGEGLCDFADWATNEDDQNMLKHEMPKRPQELVFWFLAWGGDHLEVKFNTSSWSAPSCVKCQTYARSSISAESHWGCTSWSKWLKWRLPIVCLTFHGLFHHFGRSRSSPLSSTLFQLSSKPLDSHAALRPWTGPNPYLSSP